MSPDGYAQFSDDTAAADGYAPAPPAYGAPPGKAPPGFGFKVPLQVGYGGYTQNVSVPVNLNASHLNVLGPGGEMAGRQLSMGSPGHLPRGSWSDGLFDCKESLLILFFICFCPCVRFGITINRAFPDGPGCIRPCIMWLVCELVFGVLWWVGYIVLPFNWLWIPASIVALPFVGLNAWYRMKIRGKYDIMGSLLWDYVTDLFCFLCAMCQEARHIDRDHGIPV